MGATEEKNAGGVLLVTFANGCLVVTDGVVTRVDLGMRFVGTEDVDSMFLAA